MQERSLIFFLSFLPCCTPEKLALFYFWVLENESIWGSADELLDGHSKTLKMKKKELIFNVIQN